MISKDKLIDCWVFDLGGVLVRLDFDRCIKAFNKLGYSEDLIRTKEFKPLLLDFETGRIGGGQFYERFCELGGKTVPLEVLKEAWNSMLLDVPDAKLDMLFTLKKRYKMLLLSNTNEWHWQYTLDNFLNVDGMRLDDYFDKACLSYEMGLSKPGPRIFSVMARENGLEPSRTLFIDDLAENVEAAKGLGFMTFHSTPDRDWCETLFPGAVGTGPLT